MTHSRINQLKDKGKLWKSPSLSTTLDSFLFFFFETLIDIAGADFVTPQI